MLSYAYTYVAMTKAGAKDSGREGHSEKLARAGEATKQN